LLSGRTLLLLFISLVLASGAVLIANKLIKSTGEGAGPQVEYATVLVAAMDIPQWNIVEETDLNEKSWPKDAVTQDMFTDKAKVIGKIALVNVYKDEALNTHRVVDSKGSNVFSLGLPEHMRAFTLRINDVSGVGGFLAPDNHVDVLAAMKLPGTTDQTFTETLIQDLKVLAVDQDAVTDAKKPVVVRSATLEMTPQQAEVVFNAQQQGSIQLALRNPIDRSLLSKPELVTSEVHSLPPPKVVETTGRVFSLIRGMTPSKIQCKGLVCSETQP
jgi:pilus assembly protein CpaB